MATERPVVDAAAQARVHLDGALRTDTTNNDARRHTMATVGLGYAMLALADAIKTGGVPSVFDRLADPARHVPARKR